MLKRTLVAAALLSASSAGAQTLEEAVLVLYDPINTNQWELSNGVFRRDRSKQYTNPNNEDWWTISVKNCIVTTTRHAIYPKNPDYNYAWINTLDLNRVIGLTDPDLEAPIRDGSRAMTTRLRIAKGAQCFSPTAKDGVNTRIPAKTDECHSRDIGSFGIGGFTQNVAEIYARTQKALAFIRQNFCKGREF